MTLEELREIFSKAEIIPVPQGEPPMYQFYTFTSKNRGASVVAPNGIDDLLEPLANFKFHEYAPGGIPVFVEIEMLDSLTGTPGIENN